MCVYFLPTHTIGESVLPAHFLRVIRRSFRRIDSCGSFIRAFVGRSCGSLFGRPRSCGNFVRWVILSFIRWVIRLRVLRVRWVILFGSARGSHSLDHIFRWVVGVFALLLVGSFHVGCLIGIRSRDLTGLLSFCTVESL
jgi:hypothetical protein